MRIDVFTLFPELISGYCGVSLLGKAMRENVISINLHDIRDYGLGVHRSVDDEPYGGGAGMIMRCEPIFNAVNYVKELKRPLFLLSPTGKKFDQKMARQLSNTDGFSMICGRYEGFDERIAEHLADEELSVGDFVLAGGELGALVVIESVARLLTGFMGNGESVIEESFNNDLLESPQYTRPAVYGGFSVPKVLTEGDHAKIKRYKIAAALYKTIKSRPDLIELRGGISEKEQSLIDEFLTDL